MFRDRRRRRQTRRLHPHQVNGLRHIRIARNHKIRDPFPAWRNEFRSQPRISKLQVLFLDFRQQRFCAMREICNWQALLLVIVFPLDVRCRRPQ